MEIRQLTAEQRLTTTYPLQEYAFGPSPATEDDDLARYVPYNREVVGLAAFEDDVALASAAGIPMRQNVRGLVVPMAGIASVTSHPLARRRGFVRELMRRMLGDMRGTGHVVSALYPFRPSFYERFGYVSVARTRAAVFSPAGLAGLLRSDLPGMVAWRHIRDGYAELRSLTTTMLAARHGFAVMPESRALLARDLTDRWLVTARNADGRTTGAAIYKIDGNGGELWADTFLYRDGVARTQLLQFFARHVDQVDRVALPVAPDEQPELWGTDLAITVTTEVAYPSKTAPMVRVLDLPGLAGMAVGDGRAVVEVAGDEWVGGRWELGSDGGKLTTAPTGEAADATLTVAGLSALVYGVLTPEEVALRGFGTFARTDGLSRLFPRAAPFVWQTF